MSGKKRDAGLLPYRERLKSHHHVDNKLVVYLQQCSHFWLAQAETNEICTLLPRLFLYFGFPHLSRSHSLKLLTRTRMFVCAVHICFPHLITSVFKTAVRPI